MLAQRSPHEAYRRVDFDARVGTADPAQLVTLCYEQLVSGIGTALVAHDRGDNRLKSQSLTRALSAVTALRLGVSGEDGVAMALHRLYEAARRTLLDSALAFDAVVLRRLRADFVEIAHALTSSSQLT